MSVLPDGACPISTHVPQMQPAAKERHQVPKSRNCIERCGSGEFFNLDSTQIGDGSSGGILLSLQLRKTFFIQTVDRHREVCYIFIKLNNIQLPPQICGRRNGVRCPTSRSL